MFEVKGTTGGSFKRELPMCTYHGHENGIKQPQNTRWIKRPRARDGSSQPYDGLLVPNFLGKSSQEHHKTSPERPTSVPNG